MASTIPYSEMEHPLPVGTRCRLTRAHVETLRREGRHLSEASQTFTILKSGVMGQDIPNEDYIYENGAVGYSIKYDDSSEVCNVSFEEFYDYEALAGSSTATTTSTSTSKEATKAYCKPNACFNPSCEKENLQSLDIKTCARCKWAKYCSQDCQRAHWKQHKQECNKLASHHDATYGKKDYIYNKKKSRRPNESSWSKWDVKKINGTSLSLQCYILGKPCTFDPCILNDNPTLLNEIKTYFESGSGCSVALERQMDGSDKVVAAYNENIPL